MTLADSFSARPHGGGLDAAIAQYGGRRAQWLDLSTGINPRHYPVPELPEAVWTALPDRAAEAELEAAARDFWMVPPGVAVLAAPGASALIAQIPRLAPPGRVRVLEQTYNEHEASFVAAGWEVVRAESEDDRAEARVVVHPNNPTGLMWSGADEAAGRRLVVIDESFCDVALGNTHVRGLASQPGVIVLKSFGKFWGLPGLRLGFAIGDPDHIARLREMLGPWQVSGLAQHVGTRALKDMTWANETRQIMHVDVARMDAMVQARGAEHIGGTALFRLYEVGDAAAWQKRLARGKVWSRTFPYAPGWLRLGLPPQDRWNQLEAALR